jgi:hypothetical protein
MFSHYRFPLSFHLFSSLPVTHRSLPCTTSSHQTLHLSTLLQNEMGTDGAQVVYRPKYFVSCLSMLCLCCAYALRLRAAHSAIRVPPPFPITLPPPFLPRYHPSQFFLNGKIHAEHFLHMAIHPTLSHYSFPTPSVSQLRKTAIIALPIRNFEMTVRHKTEALPRLPITYQWSREKRRVVQCSAQHTVVCSNAMLWRCREVSGVRLNTCCFRPEHLQNAVLSLVMFLLIPSVKPLYEKELANEFMSFHRSITLLLLEARIRTFRVMNVTLRRRQKDHCHKDSFFDAEEATIFFFEALLVLPDRTLVMRREKY